MQLQVALRHCGSYILPATGPGVLWSLLLGNGAFYRLETYPWEKTHIFDLDWSRSNLCCSGINLILI